MTSEVFLGLGSNLSEPWQQLQQAIWSIGQLPGCQNLAASSPYQSKPMGPQDQPDYINAVLHIQTNLSPEALLSCTQRVENVQGRVRDRRWGARTLDIDILLYEQLQIQSPDLIIPHYGMKERAFVLMPLAEIAPALRLPTGEMLQTVLETTMDDSLIRLTSSFSLQESH